MDSADPQRLVVYRRCIERIRTSWPMFRVNHADRLRHGDESERTAEAVVEDLFTTVLDWSKGDLMYQVDFADIVVSHHLSKYLVIEVKRPGTLFPGRRALGEALRPARRYADAQQIPAVAAPAGRSSGRARRPSVDRPHRDRGADRPVDLERAWDLSTLRKAGDRRADRER